jgi:hypothetical protein
MPRSWAWLRSVDVIKSKAVEASRMPMHETNQVCETFRYKTISVRRTLYFSLVRLNCAMVLKSGLLNQLSWSSVRIKCKFELLNSPWICPSPTTSTKTRDFECWVLFLSVIGITTFFFKLMTYHVWVKNYFQTSEQRKGNKVSWFGLHVFPNDKMLYNSISEVVFDKIYQSVE